LTVDYSSGEAVAHQRANTNPKHMFAAHETFLLLEAQANMARVD
jgi:hypothetical protein